MKRFSFFKKEFVKNVLTLITGSAISQVIIYLAILLLTRLFSPELFGVYMLFSSVTLILKPLASLKYELAIVLPKSDKDAINLFAFAIILTLLLSSLILLVLLIFKLQIIDFFKLSELSSFIYFIPLSVLLFGFISIFDYWNNRINMFKNISKGLVAKSAIMSSSQVLVGVSKYNSFGLIPGLLIGQIFQLFVLIKLSLKSIHKLTQYISISNMAIVAKKYKDIPFFNTIINLTNNISNELPILLITKYFDIANVGIYGLAVKFTRAPIGIIQESVSQVFYNRASKIYNTEGNLHELVKKTTKKLLLVSSFVFIPIFIVSFFLDFIFGDDWLQVGLYARILIPWLFLSFLSNPLTPLIIILNKQKTILYYDIVLLVSRFLALYLSFKFYNDIVISLLFFSGIGMLFNIFIFTYLLKISKEKKEAYL
jgi:O-antigen/teichoic acid export membrane protein